jgi:hypothetical protein
VVASVVFILTPMEILVGPPVLAWLVAAGWAGPGCVLVRLPMPSLT